jgi:hypothetical protein
MVWHAQVAVKKIKSVKLQVYWSCSPELIQSRSAALFSDRCLLGEPERRVTSVTPHTYAIGLSLHRGADGGINHVPALRRTHSRDGFLFRVADYRRQDGSDEIVRGEQPRRIVSGIGCRAAPVALTKDLSASTRNDRRLSEGGRLGDVDGGSA